MDQFLWEIHSERSSIKTGFKSYIQDMHHNISEIGERVDDLERTVDARSEDEEMLWCRVTALKKQQIELQMKEDLEN
ncbi:hypothetical protein NDU88_001493 [Pleurodeles waltl]|uniref:Uncharacterized protein n=1 Tax=Pleurodeles waltl TaxID=8319 RepID=A0AAV7S941_PLEWA|nr:hypothetical protein NDU88_001493 [Pleurodeles waltl]